MILPNCTDHDLSEILLLISIADSISCLIFEFEKWHAYEVYYLRMQEATVYCVFVHCSVGFEVSKRL